MSLVLAHFLKYNLNKGYRKHGVFEIDTIYKVSTVVVELIVASNYMVFCGIWFIYDTILVVLQSTVPLSITEIKGLTSCPIMKLCVLLFCF